jgi:hypothetical protein
MRQNGYRMRLTFSEQGTSSYSLNSKVQVGLVTVNVCMKMEYKHSRS